MVYGDAILGVVIVSVDRRLPAGLPDFTFNSSNALVHSLMISRSSRGHSRDMAMSMLGRASGKDSIRRKRNIPAWYNSFIVFG